MNARVLIIATICFFFTSCVKNAINSGIEPEKPNVELFDFNTKSKVDLSLNYGFTGYSVPFEVYVDNPLDEDGLLKSDISPIYGAFTDSNSSFNGKIELPSSVSNIYVYSDAHGAPKLLELDINDARAEYNYVSSKLNTRSLSYDTDCYNVGSYIYTVSSSNKLYGIYNKYIYREGSRNNYKYFIPSNNNVSGIYSEVSRNEKISDNSTIGELLTRITSTLKKRDNSFYCSESKVTNLRIAEETVDGKKIESAHIDLVYLSAAGGYSNAMGYYYYKSGTNLSAQEIKELPKFIVFPRTTSGKPGHFIKSRLQFFGEDYVQSGVDHFPAGYTIGWILIADFAGSDNKDLPRSLSESSQITDIHTNINHAYALSNTKRGIYSNKEANNFENYGCVTLGDKLSGRVVIGFEDQSYKIGCGDKSYEDILFYVDCDPIEAIFDPARPEIPEKPEEDEIIRTQTTMSTLAFEDIWPSGGDYDMNDVVVECYNTITYNQKNFIKKIETKVLPVHTGAMLSDAFGIIFKGEIGDILSEESNYFRQEEDNQFIFFDNIRQSVGKTLKLVREFSSDVDKLTYDDSFNPFIVISYEPGVKNRKEVHLPNNTPSPWINQDLIGQGQDMYFLDKGGKYPFAIELFDVTNWEVVTEKSKIGSENEYPEYINWVESFGQNNKDWYKYKNGR